ncbi:MAG: alpha/beta hydrolase [Candidatus Thorarchaeota archaeon]|jgi:pimeloyl-ACP methyl ester carboxylesterase
MPRPRYLILIVSILIMLSGVAISASVQNGFGTVFVTEVDFQAADGSWIHSTLQQPNYATDANPLPGVVVIHGVIQCKEWLMAFGIELSRRGFVVLTIDANAHGNSEPGIGGGAAALDYLAGLDYVDSSAIGLIGHSMGGGIAWSAIQDSSVNVDALVLVGSGTNRTEMPYIPNTLLAIGEFDSLFSYTHDLNVLEGYFGVTGVEAGVTYGSFGDNSARRVVLPRTNHLFETIDPVIVAESVDWMKEGLKDGVEDAYWIPSADQIYPLWLAGGFIGLLGVVLTQFPLLVILIGVSPFRKLRGQNSTERVIGNRTFIGLGIIYAAIGLGTFYPLLGMGFVLPFPQAFGSSVFLWILGSGLLSFLILKLIRRKRPQMVSEEGEAPNNTPTHVVWATLLMVVVTVWIYAWTLFVDLGLALDFRCFLPGFNDLTTARALMVPVYFIPFLVYFNVESGWLMGAMRTKAKETWTRTQIDWTLKAILIKCSPYFILLMLSYGYGMITGFALLPDMIGFSFLFFYAFAPWFAITTVVIVWGHHLTGQHWLGPLVNAVLFSWVIASIFPIVF